LSEIYTYQTVRHLDHGILTGRGVLSEGKGRFIKNGSRQGSAKRKPVFLLSA